MKYLLVAFLTLASSNIYSQSVKLQDDNISMKIEFTKVSDTTFNYEVFIDNKGGSNIYLYFEQVQKSYLRNYVGIGLYSHIYPYLPIHTESFKTISVVKIEQKSTLITKGTFIWSNNKSIAISLDYYIDNKQKYKGKNTVQLDLKSYDRWMKKLKSEFNFNHAP